MEFMRRTLRDCSEATGTVVVIDVVRAFTTAAYAFAAGAREIVLTDSVEEAFDLRERCLACGEDVLLMGEVGGAPIEGFDLGNSPAAVSGLDLRGRRIVQRTSAGTRGVVCASAGAETLLPSSLVVGRATARYLWRLGPDAVTFVITGAHERGHLDGDEDAACADYIEALLTRSELARSELARSETGQSIEGKTGQSTAKPAGAGLQTAPPAGAGLQTVPSAGAGLQTAPLATIDVAPYAQRVRGSFTGRLFGDPAWPHLRAADIAFCTDVDRFAFCLRVEREEGLLVMRPHS